MKRKQIFRSIITIGVSLIMYVGLTAFLSFIFYTLSIGNVDILVELGERNPRSLQYLMIGSMIFIQFGSLLITLLFTSIFDEKYFNDDLK